MDVSSRRELSLLKHHPSVIPGLQPPPLQLNAILPVTAPEVGTGNYLH